MSLTTRVSMAASRAGGACVPAGRNLLLAGILVAVQCWTFVGVPLLLPLSPWWGLGVLPAVLATVTFWALIHEGIHRHLHPDAKVNDGLSRLLSVLFGAPFRILRTGHLGHHQLNGRACERPELQAPPDAPLAARAVFYARLTAGVYLSELAGNLLGYLPARLRERIVRSAFYEGVAEAAGAADAAARAFGTARAVRELRIDGAAALLVLAAAAWLYGEHWGWLAAALAGRAFLVSLMDNAFHYGGPLGDPHSAHNLALPGWLAAAFLHFNLHRVHHRHPNLPWTSLPGALARDGDRLDAPFLPAVLGQFRGPIGPASPG
jgi:fatty acid desaturase